MKIKGFYYLGTGAGLPSLFRNVSAMAVDFESEWFLFDCGEGTQQSVLRSALKLSKLTHIFISHFHGDHIYGLPGLLSTMQLQGLNHDLTIIGPSGIQNYLDFTFQISETKIKRKINYIELSNFKSVETIYQHKSFIVRSAQMKHRITCFAYRLELFDLPGKFDSELADKLGVPADNSRRNLILGQDIVLENGQIVKAADLVSKKVHNPNFTYVTDTSINEQIAELADKSDYLHHECTFADDEHELALKSGHCTISQVLDVAKRSNIKQLHLAHFSSRYDKNTFESLLENQLFKIIMTKDKMYIPV